MKVIEIDKANIKECVKDAQHERVIVTRRGKPIAVIAGVEGMDLEQIALGHSDEFWQLIRERRKQKTISRAELEKQLTKPSGSE
jgi:prevent-host-death family protein